MDRKVKRVRFYLFLMVFLLGLTNPIHGAQMGDPTEPPPSTNGGQKDDRVEPAAPSTEKAIFAGGCFWCMEHAVDDLPGVISTTVGYTGGHTENPTYEDTSAGGTGHAESVLVVYDPKKISYADLLDVFWHNIDPTVKDQQFCDKGSQYRSAIFYLNDAQKKSAEQYKQGLEESKRFKKIYTEIAPASQFYPAEKYHQGYHKKNPIRYKFYRTSCGRDSRLREVWGK